MPAVAATTAPPVVVLSKLPELTELMARLVVVAWVVVACSAVKFCRVEEAEARKPLLKVCKREKVLVV